MLASIKADTRRIEGKIQELFEMFPEHIPDEFLSILSGLADNVIFVNGSATVITDGVFNIIYALDFSPTAYNEIMAAILALKTDVAHK